MNENKGDKKLDWMYKGANSLVDREEYLLGKSVDKSLEQLNAEEKEKQLGIAPPKNHVEHECIPPSIRDFNKIVPAEQVDISAKLQEDPLVSIKKREEEARRQFLQNPVQLKKFQEALKAQELKKRKKHRKSKSLGSVSYLDSKILKKLKYLKDDPSDLSLLKKHKKKSKDNILDTILMHKFNQLKDKLSQDDLNDILAGKVSDSEDEKDEMFIKRKRSSSEESNSDYRQSKKIEGRRKGLSSEEEPKKSKRKISSSCENSSEAEKCTKHRYKREDNKNYRKIAKESGRENNKERLKMLMYDCRRSSSSEDRSFRNSVQSSCTESNTERCKTLKQNKSYIETQKSSNKDKNQRKFTRPQDERKRKNEHRRVRENRRENNKPDLWKQQDKRENQKKKLCKVNDESDLESRILEKLRMLRDSAVTNGKETSSGSDATKNDNDRKVTQKKPRTVSQSGSESSDESTESKLTFLHKSVLNYDSDSDEHVFKPKTFGLVKSDGTKLQLSKKSSEFKSYKTIVKVETRNKSDKKNVKKLTEKEKERLRREMMKNAERRDKERSVNLRRYRESDEKEARDSSNFDKEFVHRQLLRTTKNATMETRIKSNLNNIQRSSKHMDSHFSRK